MPPDPTRTATLVARLLDAQASCARSLWPYAQQEELQRFDKLFGEAASLLAGEGLKPAWQPIDSAPKDGTLVLVSDGKSVAEMSYRDGAWYEMNNDPTDAYGLPWYEGEAKHWMPLPAPPPKQEPTP